MRDEENARVERVLKALEQAQDLSLHRHVEGGGGLVGDDELGVAAHCHGDHDALAHTTGELVRIRVHTLLGVGDTHETQHLDGTLARGLLVETVMQADVLDHLGANLEHRVKSRHRVLEDHRDVLATKLAELSLGGMHDVLAVEHDAAALDLAGLGQKVHQRARGDGLAGTRLTNNGKGLAAIEREAHAVDGLGDAGSRVEVRLKVVDLNKMLRDLLGSRVGLGSLRVVLAHRAYLFCFGSRTSRIPSPNRLKPRTVTRMNMPEIVAM